MTLIRHTESRRHETPNAVMTTLASPTLGAAGLVLWRVEMAVGAAGPLHDADVEQVWSVLAGAADLHVAGEVHEVGPGDTVVVPAGAARRVLAGPAGMVAVVAAPPGTVVYRLDDSGHHHGDPVSPPWTV